MSNSNFFFGTEKLHKALHGDTKDIGIFLTAYTHIEGAIEEYIKAVLDKNIFEGVEISFNKLVDIAVNLELDSSLASAAKRINGIRNAVAHNDGDEKIKKIIKQLESALTNAEIEIRKSGEGLEGFDLLHKHVFKEGAEYHSDTPLRRSISLLYFFSFMLELFVANEFDLLERNNTPED